MKKEDVLLRLIAISGELPAGLGRRNCRIRILCSSSYYQAEKGKLYLCEKCRQDIGVCVKG